MKMSNVIIVIIVTLLVAGGAGFYGGMTYQKGKQPTGPTFARNGNFPGGGLMNVNGRNRGDITGGGMVRGEVTAVSGSTVTVKLSTGSSKLVILGSSTTVTTTESATVADVTVGETVAVVGTTNTDGSVTATSVQLNPTDIGIGGTPPTQAQ
jgi:hypothetical protein